MHMQSTETLPDRVHSSICMHAILTDTYSDPSSIAGTIHMCDWQVNRPQAFAKEILG